MFVAMMNGVAPREYFRAVFGSTNMCYEALLRAASTFSGFWSDRLRSCEGQAEIQAVVNSLADPFSAPDIETIRLFTDDELQNLLLAAKVGLHYMGWRSSFACTAKGICRGDGLVEDGTEEDDEQQEVGEP